MKFVGFLCNKGNNMQKLTNFKRVGDEYLYDSHHDETFHKETGEVREPVTIYEYLKNKRII